MGIGLSHRERTQARGLALGWVWLEAEELLRGGEGRVRARQFKRHQKHPPPSRPHELKPVMAKVRSLRSKKRHMKDIVTFGMVSTNIYYLNKIMSTLFLETSVPGEDRTNFKSISTTEEFWKFMEGPLLDGLFFDYGYNTETLDQMKSSRIYHENILLGVPQIRQLKVRNNTCIVYSKFKSLMDECFDRYTIGNEDQSDFGRGEVPEWTYSRATSKSFQHRGLVGVYNDGGYRFTLPLSKTDAKSKFSFLQANNWITRGTRAVFIDFSVYNANVNLFCIIRLVAEFPATGGVLTSWTFNSVKLLRYVSYFDYFIASCEIIFCIFIITFIIQEIKKIKEHKYAYFKSIWNLLELLLLVLSFLAISVNILRTSKATLLLGHLLGKNKEYADFYFLAFWQILYNDIIAINIFFAWIKIFKFISFNETMSQLSTTLSRCIKDIIAFAIMFFIIFFAYAQLGYLVFGSQVDDFSTFQNSVFTQFRIVLGDFNFANIEKANWVLGPAYFITFIFFVFFVLLNMFLAIINDAYSEVKADYSIGRMPRSALADQIKAGYTKTVEKLKLKKTPKKPKSEVKKKAEAVQTRRGFDQDEIESAKEMKKWKERLEQKYYYSDIADAYQTVTQQEFRELFLFSLELEKELHYVSTKLNRVMKRITATQT
ncbi:polycystic kidney disease 2-like 2 protein isoform X2 [Monodelphis domestica]|uniref:polycystic kidney disease 2-like 2 protein isoform X2 n=1 Tax=Monodelphis domestica TaxID=13616 RepID=UPI0004432CB3|nr:polycystic kidney disease 2-like 2 protein isoform X2 [Monodelphis domestica]